MLISIIIPIYNVSAYLDTCFNSIINQTYKKLQIIAVNDGSTDNSLSIIKKYAEKDSRILIIDKPNGGLASAREAGVNSSLGDYVTILDGDDSFPPDAIAKYVKSIKLTQADIIVGKYIYYYPQLKKEILGTHLYDGILNNIEYLRLILRLKVAPGVTCKMFNRKLFDNIIMPRFKSGQDIPLSVQLVKKAKNILLINEPTYNYLLRNIGWERDSSKEYIEDYYKAIRWTIDYTRQLNIEAIKGDIELFELLTSIDLIQRNGFFVLKGIVSKLKKTYKKRKYNLKLWERFIFKSYMMGSITGKISKFIVIKLRMLHVRFRNYNE